MSCAFPLGCLSELTDAPEVVDGQVISKLLADHKERQLVIDLVDLKMGRVNASYGQTSCRA
jgi:hypothetical protein